MPAEAFDFLPHSCDVSIWTLLSNTLWFTNGSAQVGHICTLLLPSSSYHGHHDKPIVKGDGAQEAALSALAYTTYVYISLSNLVQL